MNVTPVDAGVVMEVVSWLAAQGLRDSQVQAVVQDGVTDWATLAQVREDDLRELGVSKYLARAVCAAIAARDGGDGDAAQPLVKPDVRRWALIRAPPVKKGAATVDGGNDFDEWLGSVVGVAAMADSTYAEALRRVAEGEAVADDEQLLTHVGRHILDKEGYYALCHSEKRLPSAVLRGLPQPVQDSWSLIRVVEELVKQVMLSKVGRQASLKEQLYDPKDLVSAPAHVAPALNKFEGCVSALRKEGADVDDMLLVQGLLKMLKPQLGTAQSPKAPLGFVLEAAVNKKLMTGARDPLTLTETIAAIRPRAERMVADAAAAGLQCGPFKAYSAVTKTLLVLLLILE